MQFNRKNISFKVLFYADVPVPVSPEMSHESPILESIAKWPSTMSKICGFWPFSMENGVLNFRWRSRGALYAISWTLFAITTTGLVRMLFDHGFQQFFKVEHRRSVERFGHAVTIIFQLGGSIALTLTNLIQKESIKEVWNDLSKITTQVIEQNGDNMFVGSREKITAIVKMAGRRSKLLTLLMIANSTLQTISVLSFLPRFSQTVDPFVTAYVSAIITPRALFNDMYTHFAVLMISMIDTMAVTYKVLTIQITDACNLIEMTAGFAKKRTPQLVSSTLARTLRHGRALETVANNMNQRMRAQFIILLGIIAVKVTFLAFFATIHFQTGVGSIKRENIGVVPYAVLLFALCSSGEDFISQASKYGIALGQIDVSQCPPACIVKVQMEHLRFSLKPPIIAPGYFFTINNGLLSSISAALVTYFIVLMQFDHDD